MTPEYVLTMSCPDKAGIVAATTGCLADLECFITKTAHFADSETARFFGPKEEYIVAGSDLGRAYIWDSKTCQIQARIRWQ